MQLQFSVVFFCVFALVLALVGCSSAPEHILTYERGELTTTEINGEDVPSIYIYIPNLATSAEIPTDIWGMRRRKILHQHRNGIFVGMLLSGKLNAHLAEID